MREVYMRIPSFLGWASFWSFLYLILYSLASEPRPGETVLAAVGVLFISLTLFLLLAQAVIGLLRLARTKAREVAERRLTAKMERLLFESPRWPNNVFAILVRASPGARARSVELLVRNLEDKRPSVRAAATEWLARLPAILIQEAVSGPEGDELWTRMLDGVLLNAGTDAGASLLRERVEQDRCTVLGTRSSAARGHPGVRDHDPPRDDARHGVLPCRLDRDALRRMTVTAEVLRVIYGVVAPPTSRALRERIAACARSLLGAAEAGDERATAFAGLGGGGRERLLDDLCACAAVTPDAALVAPFQAMVRILRPTMLSDRLILSGERDGQYANENTASQLLAALGACSSRTLARVSLDHDRRIVAAYDEKLKAAGDVLREAVERHNRLVDQHNGLAREAERVLDPQALARLNLHPLFTPGDPPDHRLAIQRALLSRLQTSIAQIHDSAAGINTLRSRIDALENQLWSELSPAWVLLRVAEDENAYGTFVRQGAIRGLGFMTDRTGLSSGDQQEIARRTAAALTSDSLAHLRTWEVRLRPNSSLTDAVLALHAGLSWLARHVSETPTLEASRLVRLVQEARTRIPQALRFLERHPLRLMTLADRRDVLGECEIQGFRIYWQTRFRPPKGQGPVESREIILEDLSQPNRLGTAAELFQHPLLLLPTLYHEYLHAEGFDNEAEVHLRELFFLRSLIAEMAPPDDAGLPTWHGRVLSLLYDAGRFNLIHWLGEDWDRPGAAWLVNDFVERVYGLRLSEAEARAKAEAERDAVDAWTRGMNTHEDVLGWHPEITFPMLSGPGSNDRSRKVGERLLEIVVRRSTAPRTITSVHEVVVRGGDVVREQMRVWEAYRRRTPVLEEWGMNPAFAR
jgi:hypothetical protein